MVVHNNLPRTLQSILQIFKRRSYYYQLYCHPQTLYQYRYLHSPSVEPIPVHQKPHTICYSVTYCHHTIFRFIRHLPISIPYSSSLYTPPSSQQIILHIVKRRTYYYQLDCQLSSADPLPVQLQYPPVIRHYSSSSAALYHLLYSHLSSSDPVPVHQKFSHQQNLFQFITHSLVIRSDHITYC